MVKRDFVRTIVTATAVVFFCAALSSLSAAQNPSVALTGLIHSEEEGPMEGVLVSAKRTGSTITVTVASDQQGRYNFPRNRLEPGQYSLSVRAVGYEADAAKVQVTSQKTATVDWNLHKAQDTASQLTNGEWLASIPGDRDRKIAMLGCITCHTLQRIVYSHHDATEFTQVMQRMSRYSSGASPLFPQLARWSVEETSGSPERFRKQAEFLSTINLSRVAKWEYPLQTLPRPRGRATHLIVTEYELPREMTQPHDVIVDSAGMVWYSDFGQQYMGKLDPKTGKATDYPVPELKPGFPRGGMNLEQDKDGNLWLSLMEQGGIARFDKATERFQTFAFAQDEATHVSMLSPTSWHVDGKVWMKDDSAGIRLARIDVASGKIETIHPYSVKDGAGSATPPARNHSAYGIAADSKNNLFLMDTQGATIVRADARTGAVKIFPTPTPDAFPRRGHMDSKDRLWFAEFRVDKVAMFDTEKEQFQEWPLATRWTNPYDATIDKNGEVWTGGMSNDRVVRLDTKSGQTTEYLLPHETNIRRVFVDNSTTPVTFWVGDNHHHSVIKLEPLD